jgi:hypothetical protein
MKRWTTREVTQAPVSKPGHGCSRCVLLEEDAYGRRGLDPSEMAIKSSSIVGAGSSASPGRGRLLEALRQRENSGTITLRRIPGQIS